ncbi:hypothetical protein GCM10010275_06880 [Streptomyces litmocidini]|nr:hypothetical protein GCM10010275_06880 [Streptomyces litmocidini]
MVINLRTKITVLKWGFTAIGGTGRGIPGVRHETAGISHTGIRRPGLRCHIRSIPSVMTA